MQTIELIMSQICMVRVRQQNIGCNIVYSSSDGGNYSIILMEFDSGNRIMTYCYWEVQKDGK